MATNDLTNSGKSKKSAAFLKDHGVRRTTGQCPLDHRHPFSVKGDGLLNHFRQAHAG